MAELHLKTEAELLAEAVKLLNEAQITLDPDDAAANRLIWKIEAVLAEHEERSKK